MTLKERMEAVLERDSGRAVSPVIGVVLMVAITVILAAIIGTFVMGLGDSVQSNVQAGVSVDANAQADSIDVTFNSEQQDGTVLSVNVMDASDSDINSTATLSTIGESRVFSGNYDSDSSESITGNVKVVVTAEADGRSTVIYSETHDL